MQTEGLQPFTPTRIEWLTLTLNATNMFQYNFISSINKTQIDVTYRGISAENTIIIMLNHNEGIESEKIGVIMQALRQKVIKLAKSFGWDTWIKVKENIVVIKNKEDSDLQDN